MKNKKDLRVAKYFKLVVYIYIYSFFIWSYVKYIYKINKMFHIDQYIKTETG